MKKSFILTISNEKGGVGKTTTAREIGLIFTQLGYRVLFIDLDAQGNLTRSLTGNRYTTGGAYSLLKGDKVDVIKVNDNADLIPSTRELTSVYRILDGKPQALGEALKAYKNKYNFVFIDTPPGTNAKTITAYYASDFLIIPTEADNYTLDGFNTLFENFYFIKGNYNKDLKVLGVLLTKYDARGTLAREYKETMEKYTKANKTRVFNTVIRNNTDIKKASGTLEAITDYNRRSNGAQDYLNASLDILKAINEETREG